MPVTIYTRETCAPCRTLKKFFSLKNVTYEEKNVDSDPSLMEEVVRLSGFAMVPCVKIGDKVISGANIPAIMVALRPNL